MKSLIQSLLSGERPDLEAAFEGAEAPALTRLSRARYAGRPLLEHTRALLDALLEAPPPPLETDGPDAPPWWSPTPAAYVAAVFLHVGLPEVGGSDEAAPPHALQSARIARELLRGTACPFTVREHALALIRNQDKPASLLGSGALPETYMQFACALDLRTLYRLGRAEAALLGREKAIAALEAFRDRCCSMSCFGRLPPLPLTAREVADLGFSDRAAWHRALNALRYFRLVARLQERDWCVERLRQERKRPPCRLHLLVGPAGSGKSSWARGRLAETVFVSSDRMRRELTGDPTDQSQNYLVFQRCMDRVREELGRGREVTFDATNYSEKLRQMPVQAGRWSGAEIFSYFLDVGMETALRRNRGRERLVPRSVIERHYSGIELPALYEADRHFFVDEAGEVHPYWPRRPGAAQTQSGLAGMG